ncbi:hypothetical protein LOD99_13051 [Oopsacas minuta]|uniref:Uncharacterized protein n=1 Tax=Oopsacas minuta TaxID=111878 RepID=A0AAV7JAS6_9METZ|nr:hypothetical protein LOD99_13051 [Oopsacas minuta]
MAFKNSTEVFEPDVMNNIDEKIHSIAGQYREKYKECGSYLKELRVLKEELLEKEAALIAKVEASYDIYIRQIRQQRDKCKSAVCDEYSMRTKHVQNLINTFEIIHTQLSEYTRMSTSQPPDNHSDTESVGSAVFSDVESVSSDVRSPLLEPQRVERDMLSYQQSSVVFGRNGVKKGEFRNLRGIAVDFQNRIFVVDCGNKRVQVFDENTKFLFEFGSLGSGDGEFLFPFGIAVNGYTVYVTDSERHNIQAFNLSGIFLYKTGVKGGGSLQFNVPCGLAVSTDGKVFIADSVNNRIQVFTSKLKYKSRFGHKELRQPCDVCFSHKEEVIVLDHGTLASIHVYKQNGIRIRSFFRKSNLCFLLSTSSNCNMLASDCENHSIKFMSPKGELLHSIGTKGSNPNQFIRPQGIAMDYNGRLLVCDSINNRIQIF